MGDIVRCEGLGAISILDLVNILSEPKKNQSTNQNAGSMLPIKNPQRRKSLTEKTRHVCPKEGCKRSFCSQVALENHMTRHTRKYTCDTCNKTFSEHAKLKRHLLVHSGERPFKCPFDGCGKRFSLAFNLTTHMRIHTGDKPFKCTICDKSFTQSANLKQHSKIHLNESRICSGKTVRSGSISGQSGVSSPSDDLHEGDLGHYEPLSDNDAMNDDVKITDS